MRPIFARDGIMMRTCTVCNVDKPVEEFHKKPKQSYGISSKCKVCTNKEAIVFYDKYKEKKGEAYSSIDMTEQKTCTRCKVPKPMSEFDKGYNYKDGIKPICKSCRREEFSTEKHRSRNKRYNDNLFEKNPVKYVLTKVKYEAKKRGVTFSLTEKDIFVPKFCPILGVPLERGGNKNNLPSVDRINPKRGYVPGNVHVISYRANRIKNDATLKELKSLVAYLESLKNVDWEEKKSPTVVQVHIDNNENEAARSDIGGLNFQ